MSIQNSFELIGAYRRQAKIAGVSREKIEAVTKDATSGDREHLEEVLFEALSEIE